MRARRAAAARAAPRLKVCAPRTPATIAVGLMECRFYENFGDTAEMRECTFTRGAGPFRPGDVARRAEWRSSDMRLRVFAGRAEDDFVDLYVRIDTERR